MEFSRTASANASHSDWENKNGSASNNCGMQGRIHPRLHRKLLSRDLSCHEIRAAESAYAFSPQEIHQGTLGLSLHDFLAALKEAGLRRFTGWLARCRPRPRQRTLARRHLSCTS